MTEERHFLQLIYDPSQATISVRARANASRGGIKAQLPPRADPDDFVACYNPKNRHERKDSERFKGYAYEELLKRDKHNLDIVWIKDKSLEDSANLRDPDIIAAEIVEDLQAALAQFAEIAADLKK